MQRLKSAGRHVRVGCMILTYKYRLLPTRRQHEALTAICESQRILYNAALEERIGCYQKTGGGLSYFTQCQSLTRCRAELPELAQAPVNLQRWTLKRLEDAIAFEKGDTTRGIAHIPDEINVAQIRATLKMTQEVFANTFALSLHTVRDWEHGRRTPQGPARVLLTLISKQPELVREALEAQ